MMLTSYYKFQSFTRKNPKLFWGSFFAIGSVAYLKLWLPLTNLGIPCPFHTLTGLYCPGCGVTRAAIELLQFNFQASFHYNMLIYSLIPLYGLYWLSQHFHKKLSANIIMIFMITLTITFGILRNIPYFSWLAPN
ncbi:DUF2752 domain-containing protein [Paenibacillus endoradicis]|uniref:DUF2752 domain-containing protein n=1 Tax=Paenibacillus endoradicis TaxID=2972487 RepID=UPI00280BF66A|nr:DUF2752 domain-containing protein [Paenibacillus endoradicis]